MSRGLISRALPALRRGWRASLGFHLFTRLAGFALAAPLLTLAFRAALGATAGAVVSNYDIASFLLSPAGIALGAAAAAGAHALLRGELAGLSFIAGATLAGPPPPFDATLGFVTSQARVIVGLSVRVCLRLVLLALPFVLAAAIAFRAWLGAHDINYYLATHPPEWRRMLGLAALLGAGFVVAAAWQLGRWLYVLPVLVARPGVTALDALAESTRLTKGRPWAALWPVLAWWLLVAATAALLALAGRRVSEGALDWAGVDAARVLPIVSACLALAVAFEFIASGLALAGQQFLAARGHAERSGGATADASAAAAPAQGGGRGLALRALAGVFLIAAAAAIAAWTAVSRLDLRPRVEVTAHRGASLAAPENTLAAFRAAIGAGADWIELDVQRLRDGRIVVLHDRDFMRMGADARRVGELTAADLAEIDIGRNSGPAFAGEHAPLLEDVIALVRGRARLNVELKYNVPDPALAPAVVEVLRRERFTDQAVITSLDYEALQQVERIDPDVVTGHIVTAAVGDVLRSEADFLSLSAARATGSLVRRAHRAGKAVHVWTVNSPEAMLALAARGVDNIITDDPALFARVRDETRRLGPQELLGLRLRALFGRPPRELTDPAAVEPL